MRRIHPRIGLALVAALLGGCDPAPPAAEPDASQVLPDRAQPRLATFKLWLGAQEMLAEVALKDREIMTGMMFRTNLAENEGMLFVFPTPRRASFWMKNVPIPLSCAYIDPEGTILEIHDMIPREVEPIEASSDRIQFVLETPQGWFPRNHVATGTVVRTEFGSLRGTFLRDPRASQ